jgi:integrase
LHAFSLILQLVSRTFERAVLRHFSPVFADFLDLSARDLRSKMASIRKEKSGRWRAQVRRKGLFVSETFARQQDARDWAVDREREIDRGETPRSSRVAGAQTFGDLVDLHVADMKEVGKAPGRTKEATLAALKRELGSVSINDLGRDRIVDFGRRRMRQGAGPSTIGIDVGFIKLVVQHAAAVHGIPVRVEPIDLGRIALKRLGLVGHSKERDRRPTEDEIEQLITYFETNPRLVIPMGRIVRFAIATAMRQEEICRVTWGDLNLRTRMLTIRDRKDPRSKKGNDQRIPLLAVSGYDALALIEEQRACRGNTDDRIFPVNHKSVCTLFTRACQRLSIEDLHFHDLRHEGASRLFEAGFSIEQVALVTGHKDWKMLRRYTHLRPEALHAVAAARAA